MVELAGQSLPEPLDLSAEEMDWLFDEAERIIAEPTHVWAFAGNAVLRAGVCRCKYCDEAVRTDDDLM